MIKKILEQLEEEEKKIVVRGKSDHMAVKSRIEGLREDYKKEVIKNAALVLLHGELSEEVAKKLSELEDMFLVTKDTELASAIVDKINPRLYAKPISNNRILDAVLESIQKMFLELRIKEYNQVTYDSSMEGTVKNKEDLLKFVKNIIDKKIGNEALGVYAGDKVAENLFKNKSNVETAPVVVYSSSKDVSSMSKDLSRVSGKLYTVYCGSEDSNSDFKIEELDEDKIIETFQQIAKQANKKGN